MAHIYQGAQGEYYVIDGIKYDVHFPQEWANDHKDFPQGYPYEDLLATTGPEKCGNCEFYGSLRGVFVGYCRNCAREYEFKRGGGFCFDYCHEEMWENLDYMKGVRLAQIGDLYVKEVEDEPEYPEYKFPRKFSKASQTNPSKKGAQRRKRRALRNRRTNGEYVGIPDKETEDKVFGVCMFIILLSIILIASMSFYLV